MKPYFEKFKEEAELFFVTKFLYSPEMEKEFTFLIDLMFNIENDKEKDYSRGVIAFNKKYGQSKSFFFEVLHHRVKRIDNRNIFMKTTAKDLYTFYIDHGETELEKYISVKNLFIDDIGDEGIDGNKLAQREKSKNQLNVLRFVLLKRYEWWIDPEKRWKTFGTTNLSIEEIAVLYDGRLSDRLEQMVYFRHFDFLEKGSFRQIKNSRPLTREEIAANWQKVAAKKKEEVFDPIAFLNDMLSESIDYLQIDDWIRWGKIKEILFDLKLLTVEKIEEKITPQLKKEIEIRERKSVRDTVESRYKHADFGTQRRKKDEGLAAITPEYIHKISSLEVVKQMFIELKNEPNFKFS